MKIADRPKVFRNTWVGICLIPLEHFFDFRYGVSACVLTGVGPLHSQMSLFMPNGNSVRMISTRVVQDELAAMVLAQL